MLSAIPKTVSQLVAEGWSCCGCGDKNVKNLALRSSSTNAIWLDYPLKFPTSPLVCLGCLKRSNKVSLLIRLLVVGLEFDVLADCSAAGKFVHSFFANCHSSTFRHIRTPLLGSDLDRPFPLHQPLVLLLKPRWLSLCSSTPCRRCLACLGVRCPRRQPFNSSLLSRARALCSCLQLGRRHRRICCPRCTHVQALICFRTWVSESQCTSNRRVPCTARA